MKIAEALLLRKQLEAKVKQLEPIKSGGENGVFEVKTERKKVSEDIDEVTLLIPKIELAQITKEYDYYATELRKIDGAIQEANWKFEVNYSQTPKKEKK